MTVNEKAPRDLNLSGEINIRRIGKALPGASGPAERRSKARINEPFPSKAWGVDVTGKAFELDCTLDNLSSSGVYLRLPKLVMSGEKLSLVVTFANGIESGAKALLQCQVVRTEPQPDGRHGIAVAIREHHFI
jgi:hypothetical protein